MQAGFWQEIEERRSRWNVLAHPFCARWAVGELAPGELAIYASEFEHGVMAIANASTRAAGMEGGDSARVAQLEAVHVSSWRAFARATGWGGWNAWGYGEEPLPETESCARVWEGDESRTLAEHLLTLSAIDDAQRAISEVMLNGLLRHYGFEDGPATEYFRLRAGADPEPSRPHLEQCGVDLDPELLIEQAEVVHRSYWLLLDGVESYARRTCPSY